MILTSAAAATRTARYPLNIKLRDEAVMVVGMEVRYPAAATALISISEMAAAIPQARCPANFRTAHSTIAGDIDLDTGGVASISAIPRLSEKCSK